MKEMAREEPLNGGQSTGTNLKPTLWARVRGALHGPLLIGLIAALIAIVLSFYGMIVNKAAPLTWSSIALVILIAGGSWGLIAWAIATAAVEAGQD